LKIRAPKSNQSAPGATIRAWISHEGDKVASAVSPCMRISSWLSNPFARTNLPELKMTTARTDSLFLMILGTVAFFLFGLVLASRDRIPLLDFRTAYYSGKCLLQGNDPYNVRNVEQLYMRRAEHSRVSDRDLPVITHDPYLPPAFALTVPLASLPFNVAQALWFLLIAGSFILAAFLMWQIARDQAPMLAACMLSFCLANSGSLIFFGNPAGFVVPLCVLAAWCFVTEQWIPVGILSLATGLAFKPHDTAFIWVYFLLAGGLFRRRALQTLVLLAAFSIPAILWTAHLSPHFLQEISANLQVFTVKGGMNDPSASHGTEMLTNLQTITSFFWDSPRAYDLASFLICSPLLIIWAVVTLRAPRSRENAWFGLASIAAFSLLPVYHRQYDAKMIMLAVPALAILWARRDNLRWIGIALTTTAFVLNGDIPWVIFLVLLQKLHLSTNASYGRLLIAVSDFPVPLSLLAVGVFYLWVYAMASRRPTGAAQTPEFEHSSTSSATAS
jgi:hypothetical protein